MTSQVILEMATIHIQKTLRLSINRNVTETVYGVNDQITRGIVRVLPMVLSDFKHNKTKLI